MELVSPDLGTFFWMTIIFIILLLILGKFAWKPIMKSLHDREKSIDEALMQAEKAREEMASLEADNKKMMQETRQEREKLMKQAEKMKEDIINEAKENASEEANKIIVSAREKIRGERQAAIEDLKDQLAQFSVEIAEKILRDELSDDDKQKQLINNLLDDINFN